MFTPIAAVLASQQAAAVAVINPFPPGPSKWDPLNGNNEKKAYNVKNN